MVITGFGSAPTPDRMEHFYWLEDFPSTLFVRERGESDPTTIENDVGTIAVHPSGDVISETGGELARFKKDGTEVFRNTNVSVSGRAKSIKVLPNGGIISRDGGTVKRLNDSDGSLVWEYSTPHTDVGVVIINSDYIGFVDTSSNGEIGTLDVDGNIIDTVDIGTDGVYDFASSSDNGFFYIVKDSEHRIEFANVSSGGFISTTNYFISSSSNDFIRFLDSVSSGATFEVDRNSETRFVVNDNGEKKQIYTVSNSIREDDDFKNFARSSLAKLKGDYVLGGEVEQPNANSYYILSYYTPEVNKSFVDSNRTKRPKQICSFPQESPTFPEFY